MSESTLDEAGVDQPLALEAVVQRRKQRGFVTDLARIVSTGVPPNEAITEATLRNYTNIHNPKTALAAGKKMLATKPWLQRGLTLVFEGMGLKVDDAVRRHIGIIKEGQDSDSLRALEMYYKLTVPPVPTKVDLRMLAAVEVARHDESPEITARKIKD